MVYRQKDKKCGDGNKSETMSNQQLAKELHKLIIRKLGKSKGISFSQDNIWGADLADLAELIGKYNKQVWFLPLVIINFFTNYAFSKYVPLKDKNVTITTTF